MKKFKLILIILFCNLIAFSQTSKSEFSDILVEAYYSGSNKSFDNFYGGTLTHFPVLIEPNQILGNNIEKFVSLPIGSFVILQFTDNLIIDYPNQDDIFITEIGCNGEQAEVFVSEDGKNFIKLGIVDDCKTSSLDLKSINYNSSVKYIKIVGIDNKGGSPGFDLVNVKGLPNSNVDKYVDYNLIDNYLRNPDTIYQRKIILQNINFNTNSYELNQNSKLTLDTLANKLLEYSNIRIKISGHTDNVGTPVSNLNLSKQRANSVKKYLTSKGLKENRIEIEGKGESEPLRSNETEINRKTNRRVEFEIIK